MPSPVSERIFLTDLPVKSFTYDFHDDETTKVKYDHSENHANLTLIRQGNLPTNKNEV